MKQQITSAGIYHVPRVMMLRCACVCIGKIIMFSARGEEARGCVFNALTHSHESLNGSLGSARAVHPELFPPTWVRQAQRRRQRHPALSCRFVTQVSFNSLPNWINFREREKIDDFKSPADEYVCTWCRWCAAIESNCRLREESYYWP